MTEKLKQVTLAMVANSRFMQGYRTSAGKMASMDKPWRGGM